MLIYMRPVKTRNTCKQQTLTEPYIIFLEKLSKNK